MDFNDTKEEAEFRAEARSFLEKHLKPKDSGTPRRGSGEDFLKRAKDWQKTKAEGGFAQITWPKEWGGRGGTTMQQVIGNQEEGKFDAPTGPFTIGLGMCVPTVTSTAIIVFPKGRLSVVVGFNLSIVLKFHFHGLRVHRIVFIDCRTIPWLLKPPFAR